MEGIENNEGNAGIGQPESAIPNKGLFRIGEASRLTSTKPFVLRYWETEFPMLQPVKSPKGHRLYRREDIETVFTIKRLLYDQGFTIAGARRHLSDQALGTSASNGATAAAEADGGSGETAPRALSEQIAMLNRKTLLDLRDSLRSLLTVLESE
ncbi:MAG TPA: MerR family transcriptional regulator [Candidatus Acidoferrales bacterium]|jgi:DNA-binding transcriptional MerR regulator|nr:MerR family transcriptional regulator [Candidatus Acidoferrales bacterium]